MIKGSIACACAIVLGTCPELDNKEEQGVEPLMLEGFNECSTKVAVGSRRGTKAKAPLAAKNRGKKGIEEEAGIWISEDRVASKGDQGITGNSGSAKDRAKKGTRKRAKSGGASGVRATAKRSEEEEVVTSGDCKSSSNERKNEDGGSLSLSAKAETGRPPGRPKARRARCRHEAGRAGNKVGK